MIGKAEDPQNRQVTHRIGLSMTGKVDDPQGRQITHIIGRSMIGKVDDSQGRHRSLTGQADTHRTGTLLTGKVCRTADSTSVTEQTCRDTSLVSRLSRYVGRRTVYN